MQQLQWDLLVAQKGWMQRHHALKPMWMWPWCSPSLSAASTTYLDGIVPEALKILTTYHWLPISFKYVSLLHTQQPWQLTKVISMLKTGTATHSQKLLANITISQISLHECMERTTPLFKEKTPKQQSIWGWKHPRPANSTGNLSQSHRLMGQVFRTLP